MSFCLSMCLTFLLRFNVVRQSKECCVGVYTHSLKEAPSRQSKLTAGPGGGSAMHGSPRRGQSKSWETWAKRQEAPGLGMRIWNFWPHDVSVSSHSYTQQSANAALEDRGFALVPALGNAQFQSHCQVLSCKTTKTPNPSPVNSQSSDQTT